MREKELLIQKPTSDSEEAAELTKDLEGSLREERFFDSEAVDWILDDALKRQRADQEKTERENQIRILKEDLSDNSQFSINTLERVAERLDPELKKYIPQAVRGYDISHLTKEQQWEDTERFDMKLSPDLLKNVYMQAIEKALKTALPDEFFEYDVGYESNIYSFKKIDKKPLILRWRSPKKVVSEKKKLAQLFIYGDEEPTLQVYTPKFIHICGDTIKELDKRFGLNTEIVAFYKIDL